MSAYLKRPILSHKRDFAFLLYILWNVTEHHHSNFVTTDRVCIRTQRLNSVLCVGTHVQVVKLSLKRTVWGVVMSATASSCPSDKPSSGKREGNPLEELTMSAPTGESPGHTFQSLAEVWPGPLLDRFDRLEWKCNKSLRVEPIQTLIPIIDWYIKKIPQWSLQ